MVANLRVAFRSLVRRPSFTIVALATLALGIGATAAIFTVINAVVLEPLPYPESEALVRVQHPVPGLNPDFAPWGVSEAGFWAFRESSGSFEDIAAYESYEMVLTAEDVAERIPVAAVTANLFEVLGARPVLGRLLRWSDNEFGAAPVVVLGEELWRTRFAADPSLVGSSIRLEGIPRQVVGVVEAGFDLPDEEVGAWLAVETSPAKTPVNWHRFGTVARLRPGVTVEAAERDLARIVATFPERLANAYGGPFMEESGFTVDVVSLRSYVVGDVALALWILMGAVGTVLLIGCANVANLFLVRLEGARRERALRTALGASRRDLAARSLAETLLLALAAGVVALVLAAAGIQLLVSLSPELPRLDEIRLGADAVLFTLVVSLLTGLLLGLLPAIRAGVRFEWLREGTGLTASRHRNAVRGGLVVFQMALALVLLTGAGLMVRTFQNLRAVDPGVDPDGVLTVELSLPYGDYQDEDALAAFYGSLTDRVGALPGVEAVGATQSLPLAQRPGAADCSRLFTRDPQDRERISGCFASPVRVAPGYFDAMGIPVEGRTPTWSDMLARRGGVVVTRAFAEHVWPGQDPIGKTVRGNGQVEPYYHIVGVAEDVRARGVDQPPIPRVYFPMLALEGAWLWSPPHSMTLVVRTTPGRERALARPVRDVIRTLAPTAAVGRVRAMTEVVEASMARTSMAMLLLAIAATVALALGIIGLYGVISYIVEQRRTEIGIRMALGARRSAVRRQVVARAARLAGIGVVVGGLASIVTTRALATQLYGVAPGDPLTLGAVATLLLMVAIAAAWVPARRAAGVEPMRVLRGE